MSKLLKILGAVALVMLPVIADAAVAATTAIRMPGNRLLFLSSRITISVPSPIANATRLVFPSAIALPIAHRLRNGPSLSIEKPNSFGS